MVPANCTAGPAGSSRNTESSIGGGTAGRTRRLVQQIQGNLFVAIGSQIERYLLRVRPPTANAEGDLFPSAAGRVEINGDLLGVGAAAVAQIEDNFGTAGGGRSTRGGTRRAAVVTEVEDNPRLAAGSGTGAGRVLRARPF